MKAKQIFIVTLIILLATTLLFPKTKEQKYCHQYSGESNTENPSDQYTACKNDNICKIDNDSILTKEIDEDQFSYMCIPTNDALSNTINVNPEQLPK